MEWRGSNEAIRFEVEAEVFTVHILRLKWASFA